MLPIRADSVIRRGRGWPRHARDRGVFPTSAAGSDWGSGPKAQDDKSSTRWVLKEKNGENMDKHGFWWCKQITLHDWSHENSAAACWTAWFMFTSLSLEHMYHGQAWGRKSNILSMKPPRSSAYSPYSNRSCWIGKVQSQLAHKSHCSQPA